MIHNSPIVPHNVKVSVDDVVAEYQLTPLPVPCDEHETVGNAAGSFVQWPKDLVTLGQEPILLEKKKSDTSLKKNVQVPEKVESKGSVTPIKKTPPLLDNDIHSSEHCRSLRFLLNKRPPTKKSEVFKYVSTLCKDTFGFMLPSRLAITHNRDYQRQREAADYMTNVLVENKKKTFYPSTIHPRQPLDVAPVLSQGKRYICV
ncbi:hypothetical protein AgCh_035889 [Apium graveolens]